MRSKFLFKNIFALIFLIFFMGCANKNNQGIISVSGIGTVLASPDIVRVHLYFKNVSKTTEEAKNAVTGSVQNALKILKAENISDNNIQTISLNYGVENEYKDGSFIYIGQRAEQNIIVTIDDIKNNSEKLSVILDKLVLLNDISIRSIRFDIKEKTELFKQSRELAFQKALDKAKQYAALSGKTLIGVRNITESDSRDTQFLQANTLSSRTLAYVGDDRYSSIPMGEQEITTEIKVEYKIE